MKPRRLKVGIGQVPVTMGDKCRNVRAILEFVERAAAERCDLVVLPECSLAGWLSPAAPRAAEAIPGPLTRKLAGLARRHRLSIVAGIEEREDGKLYNSAVLLDRTGELRLRHRKIDELELGLAMYARGASLAAVELEGRTVALNICADSWGPQVTDALYLMGARLILSPCAWAVEPGGEATNIAWITETYRHRTRGRDLTVVAANGVGPVTQGPWKGRVLQGNSLVVGPDGRKLLEGPTHQPALLTAVV